MSRSGPDRRTARSADRASDRITDGATDFERAVIDVLTGTEPGDVLSYGDVAAEAGFPGAARAVGNILARVEGLPWWRVVTASGRLAPHNVSEQTRRLAAEGVACRDGRVVTDTASSDITD